MALSDIDIGAMLLEQSYVSEDELKKAQELAKKNDISLVTQLIQQGLLTQQLYENALSEHYGLEFYDLQSNPPPADIITRLPEEIAAAFNVIVVRVEGKSVTVATSDPGNPQLEEAIRLNFDQEEPVIPEVEEEPGKGAKGKKAKKTKSKKKSSFSLSLGKKNDKENRRYTGKIVIVYSPAVGVESAFAHYRKPLATRFQQIIKEQHKVAPEILEEILDDAIHLRASDIHFEPQEKIVVVRFRVDGVMHEAGRIPKEHYEGVLNRIKIDSNMRIDEHFEPQDGAIRHQTATGALDIRVSVVPLVDGEKVVMRLLSEYVRHLTLGDLGFSQEHQKILKEVSFKPFGMILTTGPTGSGKSTTLYALMKLRNSPDVNISTIEDPVEYKIAGVNHIQVNNKANLTFASGLRALVRQDPDVILVGEIRDGETADISVNAALTGHLLFSTLHANDAATAVPRLLDMGVEPFLLASTLEVIMAQRLVRRICPQCR
ncbi:MAG: GspE/PulE family protein, partial [Candidatus Peribacteraceae bacterium]